MTATDKATPRPLDADGLEAAWLAHDNACPGERWKKKERMEAGIRAYLRLAALPVPATPRPLDARALEAAEMELSRVLERYDYTMPVDGMSRVVAAYLAASRSAASTAGDEVQGWPTWQMLKAGAEAADIKPSEARAVFLAMAAAAPFNSFAQLAQLSEQNAALTAERDETNEAHAQLIEIAHAEAEASRDLLAEAAEGLEEEALKAEERGRDLRNDDATRRGCSYAATLIRNVARELVTKLKGAS